MSRETWLADRSGAVRSSSRQTWRSRIAGSRPACRSAIAAHTGTNPLIARGPGHQQAERAQARAPLPCHVDDDGAGWRVAVERLLDGVEGATALQRQPDRASPGLAGRPEPVRGPPVVHRDPVRGEKATEVGGEGHPRRPRDAAACQHRRRLRSTCRQAPGRSRRAHAAADGAGVRDVRTRRSTRARRPSRRARGGRARPAPSPRRPTGRRPAGTAPPSTPSRHLRRRRCKRVTVSRTREFRRETIGVGAGARSFFVYNRSLHGAFSHRRRVARPRARRHSRRHAGRSHPRPRRDRSTSCGAGRAATAAAAAWRSNRTRPRSLSGVRARRDDRRSDRDDDPQQRLGELAAHDERRGEPAGRCRWRAPRRGDPAAAGPRRSGRRRQVRPRRRPRHPRARQRARDRGPRRGRRRRAPAARAAGIRVTSHVFAVGAARLAEGTVVSFDAGGGACRRCPAPLRGSRGRSAR